MPGFWGPIGGGESFDLALSFGHGNGTTDQELPATASWWMTPTGTADDAQPNQVREWVTNRALRFVALLVFVDDANFSGDEAPSLVVTVDGVDTAVTIPLPAGTDATGRTFTVSEALDVPADSKLGVKFDGDGLSTTSSCRMEVRLVGSGSAIPLPPPVLPGLGLLAQWETDPSISTITLVAGGISQITDASGNAFDLVQATALRRPTLAAAAFNSFAGIVFPAAMDRILEYSASNLGLADGGARTVMCVCEPDGAAGGSLVVFKRATNYLGLELWTNGGTQFLYGNGAFPTPSDISATTPVDYGGNRLVVIWDFDGTNMLVSVNAVAIPASGTTIGDETSVAPGVTLGNNNGVFGDRGFIGKIAGAWIWDRSLLATPGDTEAALAYATKYL
jgi:hypothetical protein